MKITKTQLRRIIKEEKQKLLNEMHPRAAADDAYVAELEEKEDELATQIRHASKDIHGYKDHYDLTGKSIEELEDILYGLAHSPMQQAMDLSDRDEMEDQIGRDQELSKAEMAPQRRGMGRRPRGSKSQRRMESTIKIKKSRLAKIIREVVEASDYNIQAAINRAKDRGHTDAEISSVVDASKRDEEIIMMLDLLGSDEYPATSKEKD